MIRKYADLEQEILTLIKAGESKFQISKVPPSPEIVEVVQHAWDLPMMKRVMQELTLDVDRLPLGKLQRDQISKCYKVLNHIQKILLSGEKGKENVINALSNDFYSIIPHNFGIKIPPKIDHLLRIKDKIKVLETLQAI